MRWHVMQRVTVGVVVSAFLGMGHPAWAEERDSAAVEPGLTLRGVALTRVLEADPRAVRGTGALLARAAGATQTAKGRKDEDRARRIRVGAGVGAGVGAVMGYLSGRSWCRNEHGASCGLDTLSMRTTGLGVLFGAGIGAVMGALGT